MQHSFLLYITLIVIIVLLVMFSQKIKVAYPIILVLGGLIVSIIPSMRAINIDPEVVFIVFLPPLLSTIFLSDGTRFTASRTLKEFDELLPTETFFRIHHSHLVNLHFVKRYIRGDGGQVVMSDGMHLDVARRKKDEFLSVSGRQFL